MPYLHMIFMTGFPDEGAAPFGSAFLRKPFRPEELIEALRRELELDSLPVTGWEAQKSEPELPVPSLEEVLAARSADRPRKARH
jgi:hypothetical protein